MSSHPAPWRTIFESFPCPTCGAAPGQRCVTIHGNPTYQAHADRGRDAMRCPKCRALLGADAEPGDVCGRCEQVRNLEVERATLHRRRRP